MKNLLIVFTVLVMASAANAALKISVNGTIDPPDTEVRLLPSEHAVIDIHGDGQTAPGVFYLGIKAGDMGALSIAGAVIVYPGNKTSIVMENDPDIAAFLGVDNPYVLTTLTDVAIPPKPLLGLLVDKIDFHCMGAPNDVSILLFNGDGETMDSQVIHQIPEPITFALLGLGGLFLRRRK